MSLFPALCQLCVRDMLICSLLRQERRSMNAFALVEPHGFAASLHQPQLDYAHKNGTERTYRTGKPRKLSEELIAQFCQGLRACPGGPMEMFCNALGIVRSTFYEWLDRGKREPDTLYGQGAGKKAV
jgi:hypothetical protein